MINNKMADIERSVVTSSIVYLFLVVHRAAASVLNDNSESLAGPSSTRVSSSVFYVAIPLMLLPVLLVIPLWILIRWYFCNSSSPPSCQVNCDSPQCTHEPVNSPQVNVFPDTEDKGKLTCRDSLCLYRGAMEILNPSDGTIWTSKEHEDKLRPSFSQIWLKPIGEDIVTPRDVE